MPTPEPVPIDILYEDDDLMAVNKPAGMVVHPTYRNVTGTLLNGILWHFRDRPAIRPGLVSRLDKDTSGLVLVALSEGAHARIQRDAHAGRVRKRYLAVVRGVPAPPGGEITLPLRRDPADRRRVITDASGQACETRYRVVSHTTTYSLVECEPVTGRTHQIRVHLSASGWPIVGDATYSSSGAAETIMSRQALHAWEITLAHPVSGVPLSIKAPLSRDFLRLCIETRLSCHQFVSPAEVDSATSNP